MDCPVENIAPAEWLYLQAERWTVTNDSPSPDAPQYQNGYEMSEQIWYPLTPGLRQDDETTSNGGTPAPHTTDLLERMLSTALNNNISHSTIQHNNPPPTAQTNPIGAQGLFRPPGRIITVRNVAPGILRQGAQRQVVITPVLSPPGWSRREDLVVNQGSEGENDTHDAPIAGNSDNEDEDEDMTVPAILQRVAIHRALRPLEVPIDMAVKEYMENCRQYLLNMSASEDDEEERLRKELQQGFVPALHQGEEEMARLREELDDLKEPIAGLERLAHGDLEAWEKIREFCVSAELEREKVEREMVERSPVLQRALPSEEEVVALVEELSPAGQDLLSAFQARVLGYVRAGSQRISMPEEI